MAPLAQSNDKMNAVRRKLKSPIRSDRKNMGIVGAALPNDILWNHIQFRADRVRSSGSLNVNEGTPRSSRRLPTQRYVSRRCCHALDQQEKQERRTFVLPEHRRCQLVTSLSWVRSHCTKIFGAYNPHRTKCHTQLTELRTEQVYVRLQHDKGLGFGLRCMQHILCRFHKCCLFCLCELCFYHK